MKKKLIGIICCIVVLVLLVGIGLFASARGKENNLQEHLDLGAQYLDKLDYEKAIAEYVRALEIDPKCVDAYLGIADAHIGLEDYQSALLTAQEGYGETGDARLLQKTEEIRGLLEPKPTEAPLATPEPTQAPTATPEPVEEVEQLLEGTEALEIVVPEGVSVMNSNGGVIITKKDDLYGAANYAGEEIISNIYDTYYLMPNDYGYFALANEEEYGYKVHIFDVTGQERLAAENVDRMRLYENKAFYSTYKYDFEADKTFCSVVLYDLEKGVVLYSREEVYEGEDRYGFMDVASDDGNFLYTDYSTDSLYKINVTNDGSSAERIPAVQVTPEPTEAPTPTPIESPAGFAGNSGTSGSFVGETSDGGEVIWSNFSHGFALGQGLYDMDKSVLVNMDGSEKYQFYVYDFWNDWEYSEKSYFDNGMWKYNKGKLFVLSHEDAASGKLVYSLVNMSLADCDAEGWVQNTADIIVAAYDSINLSDSPYYLASKDEKWFYIDDSGQIVHDSFIDYTAFYGGYAMIIDVDGCAYMIDEEFNKVAGGYVADGVYTAGGIFVIEKGEEKIYLAPPTE